MSDYTKARVLLINEETGEPLTEVEIITTSREITYSNPNPLLYRVGNYPAGTTFNGESVGNILDNLLYQYKEASIVEVYTADGNAYIGEKGTDVSVYTQKGYNVEPTTLYANVLIGSTGRTTGTVKIYREDGATEVYTTTIKAAAGFLYRFSFNLPYITMDSKVEFSINDGVTSYIAPLINYYFVDPIYVGWCDPDLLTNGAILPSNYDKLKEYFEDKITAHSDTLEARVAGKSEQQAMLMNVNYDTRKRMALCILVPAVFGQLTEIKDLHGLNIISSYACGIGLELAITPESDELSSYSVYISKGVFVNDDAIIGNIIYSFAPQVTDVNPSVFSNNGMPILTSFDVKYSVPLDSRSVVETYDDLLHILTPYEGLLTYVKDIDTYFSYSNGSYRPTSTSVHVVESEEDLTETFGGWDDVAINTNNGKIYKKRYNNVWELWGSVIGAGSSAGNAIRFINGPWNASMKYICDSSGYDLVQHKSATWLCIKTNTGVEPGTEGSEEYWKVFTKSGGSSTEVWFRDGNLGYLKMTEVDEEAEE